MAAAGSALVALSSALKTLWEAAGSPVYSTLLKVPGMERVSDSSLSEWINGKSTPSKEKTKPFLALIDYLDDVAAKKRPSSPARLAKKTSHLVSLR